MPAPFIPDGYSRETLIPESDRHPAVHLVYRPMLADERRRLARQTVRLAARGEAGKTTAANLVAAAVASRLVGWDVTGDLASGGAAAMEIHPATVASLEPALFEKIATAITTFDDERPSAKN